MKDDAQRDSPRPAWDSSPDGAVAVIVHQHRLLVIRRSRYVRAPGAYCFPGGALEQGEDEATAVRRELREELAAEIVPVQRLWRSVTAWGVDLAWWEARLDDPYRLLANPAEVESFHWFTVADLEDLEALLPSNRDFLAAWRAGHFELPGLVG